MKKQVTCFFLAIIFGICSLLFPGYSPLLAEDANETQTGESYFKGAKDMYENGAFMPAVDLCYKAISLKKDRRYYLLLGHALKDVENRSLSYRAFNDALNLIIKEAESGLRRRNSDLKPLTEEFKTAVVQELLKDDDYTGLLSLLASQSIDLKKFDEAKGHIRRLKKFDTESAAMASERLYLELGRLKLVEKMYGQAYRYYAKAAHFSETKIRSKKGCASALSGLAGSLEESGENPEKLLSVLLRLYRFEDNADPAIRIQAAFIRAGKPADKKKIVKEITESAE